ncbi:MAG: hypothetical protein ACRYHQ_36520, partial [Janthinobacterium lividum]
PAAEDLLLQRARPVVTTRRERLPGERNGPGDVDHESYGLQHFLDLLLAGQPMALEMLFAPDGAMTVSPDPLWREVQAMAPQLVSRRITPFLRYCRRQAELYGAKGARAAAARQALTLLEEAEARHGGTAKLAVAEHALAAFATVTPHAAMVEVDVGEGRLVRHFELCGRKAPLHVTLKSAREMATRLLASYGARALQAEEEGGVDWKALSHAVRVGQEALELLTTGRLSFPLAGATYLLDVKLGRLPYAAVTEEVEGLLAAVEVAVTRSVLPDEPDAAAAEALVLRTHRRLVLEAGA